MRCCHSYSKKAGFSKRFQDQKGTRISYSCPCFFFIFNLLSLPVHSFSQPFPTLHRQSLSTAPRLRLSSAVSLYPRSISFHLYLHLHLIPSHFVSSLALDIKLRYWIVSCNNSFLKFGKWVIYRLQGLLNWGFWGSWRTRRCLKSEVLGSGDVWGLFVWLVSVCIVHLGTS